MKVIVLRMGHRAGRDPRISTHCGLVARALGASGIVYSGERDNKVIDSLKSVMKEWGGKFEVSYEKNHMSLIKNWKGKVAHLTMYGVPVQNVISKVREERNLLVVIGGEKVPSDIYKLADWNVSITSQPHSEIAALSIFLDRVFKGKELKRIFPKARKKIIPQEKGKKVVEK
jgi:tRNA (cytidine56-2'-O)-methyltransferase